jgi:hypothetical protein
MEEIKPWVLNCTQQDLPDRRKNKKWLQEYARFILWS